MKVLALDTTSHLCSLAVYDGEVMLEQQFEHDMHLSERLLDDVDGLLTEASCSLDQLDGFGVGIGPGSFTGVRLGVMTAKAWADVLGKPIVGVSALEAVAEAYDGVESYVIAVIRARPGAAYMCAYHRDGQSVREVAPPEMLLVEQFGSRLKDLGITRCVVCGEGLVKLEDELMASCDGAGIEAVRGPSDVAQAKVIASIALRRIVEGLTDDALKLGPLYIAPPPINAPKAGR